MSIQAWFYRTGSKFHEGGHSRFMKGRDFVNDSLMPQDLFRMRKLYTDELTSFEQAKEFIESHKNEIYRQDVDDLIDFEYLYNVIREFFKKYPLGILTFG